MLHGAVYYVTQDVDLMVQSNPDNLARIVAALVEHRADIDGDLTAEALLGNTQWQTMAGPIDILLAAVGPNETEITFRELDLSSQLFEVARGLLVPAASLDDVSRSPVLSMRRRAARPVSSRLADLLLESSHQVTCRSTVKLTVADN